MPPNDLHKPNAALNSESEAIAALEAELEEFKNRQQACSAKIKELLYTENPSAGIVYAKEIFQLQQDKLRLQVEIDCRRNQIQRIRLSGSSTGGTAAP